MRNQGLRSQSLSASGPCWRVVPFFEQCIGEAADFRRYVPVVGLFVKQLHCGGLESQRIGDGDDLIMPQPVLATCKFHFLCNGARHVSLSPFFHLAEINHTAIRKYVYERIAVWIMWRRHL